MLQEEDNMLGEERGCSFFKERVYLLTKRGDGMFADIKARLWGA